MAPVIAQRMKELYVPGTIVGVWAKGYEPWVAAYGVADLATGRALKLEDAVRIGSITKTFTGTVVLQLVDEGKVGLDEPVGKYLTGVPNGQNITVRQLGDMSSGLYNYSEDKTFQKNLETSPRRAWKTDELLPIAFKHPPYFAPGKGFHYSNTNTFLLGKIIEKVTGSTLHDEISRRIIAPLNLKRTVFALDGAMPDPHSHGYLYDDDIKPPKLPEDITDWNPSWGWAAGAIVSTLEDVRVYAKALGTGSLVSAKSQVERQKWANQPGPPDPRWKDLPSSYGFAMFSIGGFLGHNGGIPGFQSFMGYNPETEATVLIFCNLQNSPDGVTPADDFALRIISAMREK
ncbi:MAG: serine hydrolase domain-containing protein [Acidobacteriota bacterium]